MFFKLNEMAFARKKVLLRVDFNVPLKDGHITDDSRIRKSIPTIKYVLSKKPEKLVIISHLGRPDGEYRPEFSLAPAAARLQELLGAKVFLEPNPRIQNITSLPDEKIIMLENLRFDKLEEDNNADFAQKLASFADVFVFDAFGACHRAHASVSGVPLHLPSCAGLLMEKEIEYLRDRMNEPDRPFVGIIGGAKSDKIAVVDKLLQKVDTLILGGVLANTFMKAQNMNIGSSKYDPDYIEYARSVLSKYPGKVALPVDFILADRFAENAATRVAGISDDISGWTIMDIGPYTISGYLDIIGRARTVIWAGPIGVFEWEPFRRGTWDIARRLADRKITKIIGGGDSAAAIEFFHLEDKMTHVSTGGGASLELLAGNELPGIKSLEDNYLKFKTKPARRRK